MIEWVTVISLISFGLLLIVIEVIFIPGTTIAGIIGVLFVIAGIALGFHYFDESTGWTILGGSLLLAGFLVYYSFRAKLWDRFSLKGAMKGKVNEDDVITLEPGTEGVTLSALRPIGKAELGDKVFEVRTLGGYVDSGTKVKIIRINDKQIFVEPLP